MHLLGQRDIEIESSLDPDAAVEWIDLLGLYLVADRPNQLLQPTAAAILVLPSSRSQRAAAAAERFRSVA
jgi:hypothetical protein